VGTKLILGLSYLVLAVNLSELGMYTKPSSDVGALWKDVSLIDMIILKWILWKKVEVRWVGPCCLGIKERHPIN
jgi:hypothetical protein